MSCLKNKIFIPKFHHIQLKILCLNKLQVTNNFLSSRIVGYKTKVNICHHFHFSNTGTQKMYLKLNHYLVSKSAVKH